MPCRCSTILNYNDEINVVESIKEQLYELQNLLSTADLDCAHIAQQSESDLMLPDAQMAQNIKSMNNSIIFSSMISACDTHIGALSSDVERMKKEDYLWHQMER